MPLPTGKKLPHQPLNHGNLSKYAMTTKPWLSIKTLIEIHLSKSILLIYTRFIQPDKQVMFLHDLGPLVRMELFLICRFILTKL